MSVMAGMPVDGLSTDQAPPLTVPTAFFLTAPLAVTAAGVLLIVENAAFASRYMPAAMGITHLGTLGFLGSVMLGALYQMIPVVAGAPVPGIRLAHGVHFGLFAGFAALVWAFATGDSLGFRLAAGLLGAAFLAFIVPTVIALVRAPTQSDTVWGLRLAVLGALTVAALGVTLALGRGGIPIPGVWTTWFAAHVSVGVLGWLGCLILAVSWQVVPMFYLTADLPPWSRKATLLAAALGLLGAVGVSLAGLAPTWVAIAFAPLALATWLVHPLLIARALKARRRKRADGSIRFWWAGIAVAPLLLPLAALSVYAAHPRWSLLFGWVALWGWAGLIVHGMLTRIIAFLIWFHRFAGLVGRVPVPPMRRIYPDKTIKLELWLHLGTLAAGVAAIVTTWSALAIVTGAGLCVTGGTLFVSLLRALSHRAPKLPEDEPASGQGVLGQEGPGVG